MTNPRIVSRLFMSRLSVVVFLERQGKALELIPELSTYVGGATPSRCDICLGARVASEEVGRYRFGNQYVHDALFRFRVKVQKEGDWPYKRGASEQRTRPLQTQNRDVRSL